MMSRSLSRFQQQSCARIRPALPPIAHGYAKRNPATEIRPSDILKSIPKTNYARIDAKELPALLRRIEVYQGKQVTRLAMKLMAVTFVRTCELIGAKWTEFDLENAR